MITEAVRTGLNQLARHHREHLHEGFRIPLGRQTRRMPRIVVMAPDFDRPAGGIRVMYDHVDALNAAGVPAVLMHQGSGFRCTWFDSDTAITSADRDEIATNDVLVVPELFVDVLGRRGVTRPHIVLNQSGHLTWSINGDDVDRHLRGRCGLLGVIVPSQHIRNYLRYAFPQIPVEVARNAVDSAVFHPGGATKRRVLAYLDRRDTDDVVQALRILAARGSLDGWEVRRIRVSDQQRYAADLRETQVFVSTPYQEGFGMPAAEAMAAGAYVVGYHGYGGREYFAPGYSRLARTGDVLGLARCLEDVLRHVERDPDWCISRGLEASRFVTRFYSIENSRREVVGAYAALTGGERL